MLKRKRANLKEIQSLVGSINFASFPVYRGRLHDRALLKHCHQLLRCNPRLQFPIPTAALKELDWWKLNLTRPSLLHFPPISNYLVTDASEVGWGAQLNNLRLSGQWTLEEGRLHSNQREIQSKRKELKDHCPHLVGSSMLIQSDNRTVVAYLRNEGAVLLLLCSGRRVHDLILLDIEDNNCLLKDESIIFWPKFGSKTDTVCNRQSGWRIYRNKDNQSLDPYFWIQKVIQLSQSRRAICKKTSLFLTICGQPKEASSTNIGNWVKKILCQAGIKASPGSCRPAVASKNWIQNCPLDDILARGNWRSGNTFLKYNCREIQSSSLPSSSKGVLQLFTPVPD
ncbi:unnamed protein product, partial [Brenthis ino]